MVFIDSHCHLDICNGVETVIKRAIDSGVKVIVSCGIDKESNRKILEIANKFPEVKICLGIYPIDALNLSEKEIDDEIKFITANKNKIIGIGEVGIDLKYSSDIETQKKNLKRFVELSKKINKPLVIHSRGAEEECIDFLEKEKADRVLMHCFSGKLKLLDKIVKNNWVVSVPSSVKYNSYFQEVILKLPLDNLLCETDSPFLHPNREKNNEPANVIEVYKAISEIKKISLVDAERNIESNFKRILIGSKLKKY
jgi:TatD DNase family protein